MNNFIYLVCLFIVILSCKNDNESPTEPQNNAPVVSDILVNTPNVNINDNVTLTAIATDLDGDSLNYYWNCSAGVISPFRTDTNPTEWQAPDTPGDYSVTCTVSDCKETGSKSKTISVN